MNRLLHCLSLIGCLVASLVSLPSDAQSRYPDHPLNYVVPNAAGGSGDVIARALASALTKDLGRTVVVDYKPGATGVIGAQYVARSKADGYTMLVSSTGPMAILPILDPHMPFSVQQAFDPVVEIAVSSTVLAVSVKSPWHSVQDLVAAAKASPGRLSFASGGTGTVLHLQGELLAMRTGIKLIHVPYKGDAPAVTDLMTGNVSMMFVPTQSIAGLVKAGLIRVLATTSPQRLPSLPDVPTMAQAGVPDFAVQAWFGAFVPHGTPPAVIARLNTAFNHALQDSTVRKNLTLLGLSPVGGDASVLKNVEAADLKRWGDVIHAAHIQLSPS